MSETKAETKTGLAVRDERATLAVSGSVQINGIADVFKLADMLSKADGFVPRAMANKPAAVAAAIMTGLELGVGPMEAIRNIHLIDGKVGFDASYLLALVHERGIRSKWLSESVDKTAAKLQLRKPGGEEHVATFTWAMAVEAGLVVKDNWKKHPAQMLRRRCVSMAVRDFCPEVTRGPAYVPEEIEHERVEPPANAIDGEIVPDAAPTHDETGEVIEKKPAVSIDAISDAEALRAYGRRYSGNLATFTGKRRDNAIAKVKEAAARCGVPELEALAVCGLAPPKGDDAPESGATGDIDAPPPDEA